MLGPNTTRVTPAKPFYLENNKEKKSKTWIKKNCTGNVQDIYTVYRYLKIDYESQQRLYRCNDELFVEIT